MKIKSTASLNGIQPVMRQVLREAEQIWKQLGREEGVTVTAGIDGIHGAESWHYYGYALDFRINYSNKALGEDVDGHVAAMKLRTALPGFDVVLHSSHIHVEINNRTARLLGVMF